MYYCARPAVTKLMLLKTSLPIKQLSSPCISLWPLSIQAHRNVTHTKPSAEVGAGGRQHKEVWEMEDRLGVPRNVRYPSFRPLLFHAALDALARHQTGTLSLSLSLSACLCPD